MAKFRAIGIDTSGVGLHSLRIGGASAALNSGYSLRSGTSLSYTREREVVLAKFRAIGIDTSGVGLHSLRIGGASAALNSGVPDHVIKNHGRWKSDSAKELYCRENLRRQLRATSRVGL